MSVSGYPANFTIRNYLYPANFTIRNYLYRAIRKFYYLCIPNIYSILVEHQTTKHP